MSMRIFDTEGYVWLSFSKEERRHDMPFKYNKTKKIFEWAEHRQYFPTEFSFRKKCVELLIENPLKGLPRKISLNGKTNVYLSYLINNPRTYLTYKKMN